MIRRPILRTEPSRALLLLIDIQPAFLRQVRPNATDVVSGANESLRYARILGIPTVAVRTEHTVDGSSWSLNMREDGQGFAMEGSREAQFAPGLELDYTVTPLVKRRDSAFFVTPLDSLMVQLGTRQILLGGLMASSCITHTARDAYARDIDVTLLKEAIGDVSVRSKNQALRSLEEAFRQPVRSTSDFVHGLQSFDVPTLIGR